MVRTTCKISGIVLLSMGAIGFLIPDLLGLHLSSIHNIIFISTGALAIYFGFLHSRRTNRTFSTIAAFVYLLLGLAGILFPVALGTFLQIPLGNVSQEHTSQNPLAPDNLFHLFLGLIFLAVGLKESRSSARGHRASTARSHSR